MSVIGHSQGAVYAYLYGDEGAETIVYNPAPFNGKKPDNVFIIRRAGDPVSMFTKKSVSDNLTVLDSLKDQGSVAQHSIVPLDGVPTVFGNKFIFSHDPEIENKNVPLTTEKIVALNAVGMVVQATDKQQTKNGLDGGLKTKKKSIYTRKSKNRKKVGKSRKNKK